MNTVIQCHFQQDEFSGGTVWVCHKPPKRFHHFAVNGLASMPAVKLGANARLQQLNDLRKRFAGQHKRNTVFVKVTNYGARIGTRHFCKSSGDAKGV